MKLTITIEDMGDHVYIECDPPLAELEEAARHPERVTQAQGYALVAYLAMLEAAKKEEEKSKRKRAH